MAKRFTSTEKWSKEWFQNLSIKHKLLWYYLFENCDNVGLWSVNLSLASFQIGTKIKIEDLSAFDGRIVPFQDKYLIVDFISFQYGELSENCPAHKPVISKVSKLGLVEVIKKYKNDRVLIGYQYPTVLDMDMEMDKDKEKEKKVDSVEICKESESEEFIEFFNKPELKRAWSDFEEMRKLKKKEMTLPAQKINRNKLFELSCGNLEYAIKVLQNSTSNSWTGLFPLKDSSGIEIRAKPKSNIKPKQILIECEFCHKQRQPFGTCEHCLDTPTPKGDGILTLRIG